MKKILVYFAIAAMAAVSFSCSKEASEVVNTDVKKAPVTLSLGIGDATKVSLEYGEIATGKNGLKTVWEVGDKLDVSFYVGGVRVHETFEATEVATDGKTAIFYCEESQFNSQGDGGWSAVYENNTENVAVQGGTLETLPVYLEAKHINKETVSGVVLENPITYFHFVLTSETEQTYTHGYFRTLSGAGVLGGGESDVIKVAFSDGITVNSTAKDVYVACNFEGNDTSNSEYQFILMNADYDLSNTNYFDGLQSSSVTWTPKDNKSYESQKVYNKTAALTYTNGLVGPENNVIDFWTENSWSDAFNVAPGKEMTLQFLNYGDKVQTYHNWYLAVSDAPLGDSNYHEYFVLRSDTWGWSNDVKYFLDFSEPAIDLKMNNISSDNIDWSAFKNAMDGATVTMTIDHTTVGSLFVSVSSVNGDDTITEVYSQAVSSTDDIIAFLACQNSHFILQGRSIADSKKEISSLTTDPCFVYGDNLALGTIFSNNAIQNQLIGIYTDGSQANVDPVLLSDYGTATINASGAATQSFDVIFNNENVTLAVPVIQGISKLGDAAADNFDAYAWVSNGNLASENSVKAYMYLYAANESCNTFVNWASPRVRLLGGSTTNMVARLDHWIDDVYTPNTITYESNWNWDLFPKYKTRAKITVEAVNKGSNIADVHFAVQYACPNTEATKGYHFQNYKNIVVDSDNLVTEWNIWGAYSVLVSEDVALANGWPEIVY